MKRLLCVLLAVLVLGSCWVTAGASEGDVETPPEPSYVAQIGENKYTSLQEAVDSVQSPDSGSTPATITLLDDVNLGENTLTIANGKAIILEGGEYSVIGDGRATGSTTITVENGGTFILESGTVVAENKNAITVKDGGTLHIKNGKVTAFDVSIVSSGTTTISGGTVTPYSSPLTTSVSINGGKTEIAGGTIAGMPAVGVSGGELLVKSGTLQCRTGNGLSISGSGTAKLSGGTITNIGSHTAIKDILAEDYIMIRDGIPLTEEELSKTSVTGTVTVEAAKKSIAEAAVTLENESLIIGESGSVSANVTSVKLGETELTAGTDYNVSGNGPYTVPGRYTVTVTGLGNYSGTVTAVVQVMGKFPLDKPVDASKYVEMQEGLNLLTPTSGPGTYTADEAERDLAALMTGIDKDNILYFDVKLMETTVGGGAGKEAEVPPGGIDVTLPYPDNTGADTHDFIVTHLPYDKTEKKYLPAEAITHTKGANGLKCHFNSLSPVAIGYKIATVTPNPPSGGGGSGGGSWITYYKVNVEPGENGSVSADRKTAPRGGKVVLTVEPDEGYETKAVTVTDERGDEVELIEEGEKLRFIMPAGDVTVKAEFSLIPPPPPPPWENPFPDVIEGQWYYEAVEFVHVRGLMAGYANGLFGTNDTVSRAQFAQMLYNMAGKPEVSADERFSDVRPGSWYARAVCWAAQKGIVSGYSDGRFGPGDPITREQLASMLWRYAGSPEPSAELSFTDADKVKKYARPAVRWAVEKGIVNGKPGNRLDPEGCATRAEAAMMVMKYLTLGE